MFEKGRLFNILFIYVYMIYERGDLVKQIAIVENVNSSVLESVVNKRLKTIGKTPEKIVYLTDANGKIRNIVIEYNAA